MGDQQQSFAFSDASGLARRPKSFECWAWARTQCLCQMHTKSEVVLMCAYKTSNPRPHVRNIQWYPMMVNPKVVQKVVNMNLTLVTLIENVRCKSVTWQITCEKVLTRSNCKQACSFLCSLQNLLEHLFSREVWAFCTHRGVWNPKLLRQNFKGKSWPKCFWLILFPSSSPKLVQTSKTKRFSTRSYFETIKLLQKNDKNVNTLPDCWWG